MQIRKLLSRLFVCILSIFLSCGVSFALNNFLPSGDVGEYGNLFNETNIKTTTETISTDFEKFNPNINVESKTFVPLEAKLGLMLMKALSSIDVIFTNSLVRFIIIFLLVAYAAWVGLTAYKMIKESGDYKTVLYNVFKQGITIAVWILILNYGIANIFDMIVSPVLNLGAYLSDIILNAVAETYKVKIPDTCAAIHNYVNNTETTGKLLIDNGTAANIMCLPARVSVYFYHAVGTGFSWIKYGLTHSITSVLVGIASVVLFIECIFKFAFMTLGIVVDLFLTLLLLPFTAIAESLPAAPDGATIPGRIYNGFIVLLNIGKGKNNLSHVLSVFINAAMYFVSLSIIIAICAALLSNIISLNSNEYIVGSAIATILSACLVLYLAQKADELASKLGGSIDNSFGKQLTSDAKNLWNKAKNFTVSGIKKKIAK